MSKDESLFEMDTKRMQEDIKKVQKALDEAEEVALKAARNRMIRIVFDLLGEGMNRAPVHEGFLRGSGIAKMNDEQIAHTESTGNGQAKVIKEFQLGNTPLQNVLNEFMGEVAFTAKYATIQHEVTEFNHPRGGEAKYLENPLKERMGMYVSFLANDIEKALDKGGAF